MDSGNSKPSKLTFGMLGLALPSVGYAPLAPSAAALCASCSRFPLNEVLESLEAHSDGDEEVNHPCSHHEETSSPSSKLIECSLLFNVGSTADVISRSRTCSLCALISVAIDETHRLAPRIDRSMAEENLSDSVVLRSTGRCRRAVTFAIGPSFRRHALLSFRRHDDDAAGTRDTTPRLRVGPEDDGKAAPAPLPVPVDARTCPHLTARHGSRVDYDQIRHWVRTCVESHANCRTAGTHPASGPGPAAQLAGASVMRFVDVGQMCIISLTSDELQATAREYVALSYVWGTVVNMRLTTRNMGEMTTPGVLRRTWAKIPRTIRDAITLVQNLGLQLLWVDALCLVQNDARDVDEGVQYMDLVYERALFTVVSACGHDADAALPGIVERSRSEPTGQFRLEDGLQVDLHLDLDLLLDRTVYRSRAWTFQEELLSRRVLYFVDSKVYFRCRRGISSERVDADFLPPAKPLGLSLAHAEDDSLTSSRANDLSERFSATLLRYAGRALSDERDTERALRGVLRRFGDEMACPMFEGMPSAAIDLCILFKTAGSSRRAGFPSYSWTGWRGGIEDWTGSYRKTNVNAWLATSSWITWTWSQGNSPIMSLPLGRSQSCYTARRSFPPHAVGFLPRLEKPYEIPAAARQVNYSVLHFFSVAIFFKLRIIDFFRGIARMVDNDGRGYGSVRLDGFDSSTFFDKEDDVFEFIVLSTDGGCSNVLLIEWVAPGLAERRGCGKTNWVRSSLSPGPTWKPYALA